MIAMHAKIIIPISGGIMTSFNKAGMVILGMNNIFGIFIPLKRETAKPPAVPIITMISQAENYS